MPPRKNEVRIISGSLRGRKLRVLDSDGLRPTADSVRERLFNWLGQDLTGQSVLDLFSGSGALGFEAVSRGAARVVMVEKSHKVAGCLRRTREEIGADAAHIVCTDAMSFLADVGETFDIVLLDPPFAWGEWERLWVGLTGCLQENTVIYVEAGRVMSPPLGWCVEKKGQSGKSHFALWYQTA